MGYEYKSTAMTPAVANTVRRGAKLQTLAARRYQKQQQDMAERQMALQEMQARSTMDAQAIDAEWKRGKLKQERDQLKLDAISEERQQRRLGLNKEQHGLEVNKLRVRQNTKQAETLNMVFEAGGTELQEGEQPKQGNVTFIDPATGRRFSVPPQTQRDLEAEMIEYRAKKEVDALMDRRKPTSNAGERQFLNSRLSTEERKMAKIEEEFTKAIRDEGDEDYVIGILRRKSAQRLLVEKAREAARAATVPKVQGEPQRQGSAAPAISPADAAIVKSGGIPRKIGLQIVSPELRKNYEIAYTKVDAILAKPVSKRTDQEKSDLTKFNAKMNELMAERTGKAPKAAPKKEAPAPTPAPVTPVVKDDETGMPVEVTDQQPAIPGYGEPIPPPVVTEPPIKAKATVNRVKALLPKAHAEFKDFPSNAMVRRHGRSAEMRRFMAQFKVFLYEKDAEKKAEYRRYLEKQASSLLMGKPLIRGRHHIDLY